MRYLFSATLWQHSGPGGWHFISVPAEISAEIRNSFQHLEQGWGRLPAMAEIQGQQWRSAIWFDTKKSCYLLPIKAEIRKKTALKIGPRYEVIIDILLS